MATSGDEIYSLNTRSRNEVENIEEQRNFVKILNTNKKYIWELSDDKIQSREIDENSSFHIACVEHMQYLRSRIFGTPRRTPHPKQSCTETIKFFQDTGDVKKVFCRSNNGHYIVNKCFTEGVKYVKEGEVHIYQAKRRPLDIYVFKPNNRLIPLELNTLKCYYDLHIIYERVSPGSTRAITSGSYYFVIAPCPTYFTKEIKNTLGFVNPSGMASSSAIEDDIQVTGVVGDRIKSEPGERINLTETSMLIKRNILALLNGSGDNENENGRNDPLMENGGIRSSTRSNSQSKRLRSSSPLPIASTSRPEVIALSPSPNSSSVKMEPTSGLPSIGNHSQTVFAVRKDSSIESYSLRSGSTFFVLSSNTIMGSFAIENDDMDPNVFEYYGEGHYIREVAKFRNGSTYETRLAVQRDLLKQLRDTDEKIEKKVVKYFFDTAFQSIEAAYKKFYKMQNVRMVGSCVPAIIPRRSVTFSGAVSDVYEEKP